MSTTEPSVAAAQAPPPAERTFHAAPGLSPELLRQEWERALPFADYVAVAKEHPDLWKSLYERAKVPPEAAERVRSLPAPVKLLVLSEDWCGDSVNTLPVLQRLAEASDGRLEMRILARDAHPELMDAHLTGASRSIPVVMALDGELRERGWWGSRPAPLQKWVLEEGLSLPKPERYVQVRTWYVRDRGATLLAEIFPLLEHAAAG